MMMAMFACIIITSCSEDDSPDIPPGQQEQPAKPPVANVTQTMKDAFAEGTVTDTEGNPIAGVIVNTGEITVYSDERGCFSLNKVADASGRFVLTFSKEGYFTVTRSGVFERNISMQVVMQPKGGNNTASVSFSSNNTSTIEAAGMKVVVPPASLVTMDGRAYEGTVRAEMFYLSPDNGNFSQMMPGGDLAAIRTDETDATLISYGMVEVSLSDANGNKLQLKEGEQSEMTFPIPEGMKENPPTSIPLWYFDENSGLWIEEGEATLQGDVYVGNVGHFSWHNLDVPSERVTINGKVSDCQGRPVPRIMVTVEQTSTMTRSDGTYTVYVPENTPVKVVVESDAYYQYQPEVSVDVAGHPGGSVVRDVNLELPCLPTISGRVINTTGSFVMARLYCEYTFNGVLSTSSISYTDAVTGGYAIRIPLGVVGPAVLHVDLLNGEKQKYDIELTGEDITKDIYVSQETANENLITITSASGDVLTNAVADKERALTVLAQGTFGYLAPILMCDEGSVTIAYEGYDGTSTSLDGAKVAFYMINQSSTSIVFSSETAHIDILEKTDTLITFAVQAEGSYLDENGTQQNAILTATLTSKISVETSSLRTNVTDWSSLQCAGSVPVLKLPVDLVATISMYGMDIEALYYYGTMADVEEMGKILQNNGWSVMSEDGNDSSYTVIYMNSSFAMLSIAYDKDGTEGPDGNRYQICVVPMV